jgi:hypothetical protein
MTESDGSPDLRPIFDLVGCACLAVSVAWMLQTLFFHGDDVEVAVTTWILVSAVVAGLGVAMLLAGRFWLQPQP